MKDKQNVEILGSRHTSCGLQSVCGMKLSFPSWVTILPFAWRD